MMNREIRGWIALCLSIILSILNLYGIWIAAYLCAITFPVAFLDLYSTYAISQNNVIVEGHGLTDVSCVHGSRWMWWRDAYVCPFTDGCRFFQKNKDLFGQSAEDELEELLTDATIVNEEAED